ncbi:MAG: L-threonylcarbamoyladenylate synthase [Kiritimatiellia bacterium]
MRTLPFTEHSWQIAAELLLHGGVVLLPTDTVYGVACHPDFPEALERIRVMKGRDRSKPFQLLVSDLEKVQQDGAIWTAKAEALARLWPGALTLVLSTQKGHTEGYRIPDDEGVRQLLRLCGGILRCTSVNLSGEPPSVNAQEAAIALPTADLLLDGGPARLGVASTVVAVDSEGNSTVLRQGDLVVL